MAHRLATGREPVLTGSTVGALYVVGRLAGVFSLVGLAYAGVLALFTLPKVRCGVVHAAGSMAAQLLMGCRQQLRWAAGCGWPHVCAAAPRGGAGAAAWTAGGGGGRGGVSTGGSGGAWLEQQAAAALQQVPWHLCSSSASPPTHLPPPTPTPTRRPPQVYELKKPEIDAALDKARAQATQLNDKYLHKVCVCVCHPPPRVRARRPRAPPRTHARGGFSPRPPACACVCGGGPEGLGGCCGGCGGWRRP